MFENLGQRIKTFFLIAIIALLALIMGVVGFGPAGSEGCSTSGPGYAATVRGQTITAGDFNAAYRAAGFEDRPVESQQAANYRRLLLDGLIERELLVHEAQKLGYTVDNEEIMRRVADEELVLLSGPVDAPAGFPSGALPYSFRDRDDNFSTDRLRRFIQNYLRRSIAEFAEWQGRETLAQRVRDTVTAPVTVSPREVWDAYVAETERATISYVRFGPADYRAQVEVTPEAVTAWMAAHQEEVNAEYERQGHRYRNLEEQVRARHILLRAAQDAPEAERSAKRAEAEALLARAQAGEDFAALAREHSDDGSAQNGGDLGWFQRGRMVAPFEQAAFSHEEPAIHGSVVESQFGFHVIEVLGRREGNVPEAEAKQEIAEGLYRTARAVELAEQDATRALAYLREGHTTDELNDQLRNNWQTPAAPAAEGEPAEGEEPAAPAAPARPDAPQVNTTSFGRADHALPGVDSSNLTSDVFAMTLEEPLPAAPIRLGDNWVVYRLDELTLATEEGLTPEVRERVEGRLLASKRREVLSAYIGGLRAQANADGAIRENPEILAYPTVDGAGDDEEADREEEASASSE